MGWNSRGSHIVLVISQVLDAGMMSLVMVFTGEGSKLCRRGAGHLQIADRGPGLPFMRFWVLSP